MIWFLLMLVYPAQGEIPNPSIEIIKGNTTLNAGSELQLKCNIQADVSGITFKWFKDNSEISAETSQMLTINNITKDQAGVYHCSAKNGTDPEKSSSTKLNITVNYLENAVLTISPPVPSIKEGDSITFTCTMVTNLNPVSYLFRKDSDVPTTDGKNVFNISKVINSDSGLYTCTVSVSTTPPLSVTSDPVSLTVIELFEAPTLEASSNALDSGELLTLTCSINTSPSTSGIEYKFWKGTVSITSFQSSFTHTRVVQSADSGKYTCEARLNNVEKNSLEVNIIVKLKVSVTITPTVEGESMTIKCNVEGGTAMTFTWKKNDVIINGQTNNAYVVQNVHRSMVDTKYSCIATSQNSISSNEASATVSSSDIYYLESAALTISPTSSTINEGDSITFTCNVVTNVNPVSYSFQKNGNVITTDGKNVFIISKVMKSDSGSYTCNVSASTTPPISATSNSVSLTVNELFQAPTSEPSSNPLHSGESLTLTCRVNTSSSPAGIKYKFCRGAVALSSFQSSSTHTRVVQSANSGNYACVAQLNNVEKNSPEVNIVVKASGLIIKPNDKNEGKVGESYTITCNTSDYGNPPAVLAWYKSGSSTALSTGNAGEAVSYTIKLITKGSTGNYTCRAKNTAGEIEKMFRFVAIDKPDSPTLQISTMPTSITVSITPPAYTGNKPITYYTLQYKVDGKDISKNITDLTNLMYTIPELKPEVQYQLKIQAVNVIVAGQFKVLNATTGDAVKASELIIIPTDKYEGKVGEAFNMTCYASNYGIPTAVLTWYRSGNSTPLSAGNAGESVSYVINSVTRDSTGDYICKANNKAGEIEKMFLFTAIDKPDPPNFQGSSSTSTSITVLIIPPAYTGNKPITYYTLQYQGEGKDISKNTTNLVYNITELTPAVKYHVRIQAVNVIGAGQFSEFINITTGEDHTICLSCMANCNAKKPTKTTDDSQPVKIITVSVLVTLVITLVIITIVLATLKQKGLITVNKKRNEKPQNVETDDYEVAGTTHYADLHIQDSKPSFYTDLKTMNDQSNDYAEIELNETQKHIYANVKK